MNERDVFSSYHPAVNFLYFGSILAFAMISMHPVCLVISLVCAVAYYVMLKGAKATRLLLRGALPLFLVTLIINPAFSHGGVTILTYLPSGNPLTLESIIYGISAAFMMTSILIWFACFTEVMTSDKFVYLFGKIVPAFSLILSMTLRFVPRFISQFGIVRDVQRTMGRDTTDGKVLYRLKNAIACFSITVTWSMENAIETADSMKSRGYGTKRRTAYSIYHWNDRDKIAFIFVIFCALTLLAGGLAGKLSWKYFPSIGGSLIDPITIFLEVILLALMIMPVFLEKRENHTWNYLRSNI